VKENSIHAEIATNKRNFDLLQFDGMNSQSLNQSLKNLRQLQTDRTSEAWKSQKRLRQCDEYLLHGIADIIRVDGDCIGGFHNHKRVGAWKKTEKNSSTPEKPKYGLFFSCECKESESESI